MIYNPKGIFISSDGKPCMEGDAGSLRSPEPYFPRYCDEFLIPMQYTDFKDINNFDIYEEDILLYDCKNHYECGDVKSFGIVEWEVKCGVRVNWFIDPTEQLSREWMQWNGSKEFEVIGNIYENPELMETK